MPGFQYMNWHQESIATYDADARTTDDKCRISGARLWYAENLFGGAQGLCDASVAMGDFLGF